MAHKTIKLELNGWICVNCINTRLIKAKGGPGITGKKQPNNPKIINATPITISTKSINFFLNNNTNIVLKSLVKSTIINFEINLNAINIRYNT